LVIAGNARAYKIFFRKYKREEIFGKSTRLLATTIQNFVRNI